MRLATVMMVDMVGSTEMTERLGPEASARVLRDLARIARGRVEAHGGVLMHEMGDGYFALFGAPVSIDRAALAACRAGLDLLEAVAAETARFSREHGVAPQLRVGLASGEVLLTGLAGDDSLNATGSPVNLAARLQALAAPGTVLCAGSIVADTRGWARFEPEGQHALKGFSAPVEVFRLDGLVARPADRPIGSARYGGEFVGRGAEMARLARWARGEGGAKPVGLIVGEAGLGKSRLMGEFGARAAGRRLIVGACHPMATARPLAPLIEILRGFAGWRAGQGPSEIAAALAPVIDPGDPGAGALADLLADETRGDAREHPPDAIALRRALSAALTALGARPDCLLAIEDLHWIDPLSAEVLTAVIADAPAAFRFLGTTRPGDWIGQLPPERIEVVAAQPLPAGDIAVIAQEMLGAAAGEDLVRRIAESSEGNPFFAIEFLHNVVANGDGVAAGQIGAIQNVALARFDRLDAATKAQLRMASVLGRRFRFDVLRAAIAAATGAETGAPTGAATGAETPGNAALLEAAAGIVEPDPADPQGSGHFHHILFRDSIYATIPSGARRPMHRAAAEAVAARAGGNPAPLAEVLAEHYELAQAPREAVAWLRVAARHAYGLYALDSCKALMERAFHLIEPDFAELAAETVEDALSLRIRCLDLMDRFREVIAVSDAWLPRLRTDAGSPTQALLLALTAKARCHLADIDAADRLVSEALEMATRLADEKALAYAKVVRMRVMVDSGRGSLAEVERLFEETRAFTEQKSDDPLYGNRMFHMMSAFRCAGEMRRARALCDELMAFGRHHDQTHVILMGRWNRALIELQTSDFEAALSISDLAADGSVRNTAVQEVATLMKLAAEIGLGRRVPVEDMARIYDRCDARGELVTRNSAAMQIALAQFVEGRIARGWRKLGACARLLERSGHFEIKLLLQLYRAELLLTIGGLIAPPGPRPKLGPADIAVAVYLRLVARRRAGADLARVLELSPGSEGYIVARAQAGLALIDAARGRDAPARERFDLADRLLRAEGLDAELARLDRLREDAGLGG